MHIILYPQTDFFTENNIILGGGSILSLLYVINFPTIGLQQTRTIINKAVNK